MGLTLNQEIVKFAEDAATAMGLALKGALEETSEGPRINLEGEDGAVLIRRKGEALLALQHVVNTVFRHELPEGQRIALDCLGFRREKEVELRQMARYLAERARTTGTEQELGPLNPYERRLVHLTIAEDPTVDSHSVGDAFMKTVIIAARKPSR
jgi:spoIIIJ-associated protein